MRFYEVGFVKSKAIDTVRTVCAVYPVRNFITINGSIQKRKVSNGVKYQQFLKG